jgi:hypothetical protein
MSIRCACRSIGSCPRVIPVWVALSHLLPCSVFAEEREHVMHGADVILRELKATQGRISNAKFECVWKTVMEAQEGPDGASLSPSRRWEKQTFYWDDLGRRRNVLERGPLSEAGKMLDADEPNVSDTIYNGEIVNSQWHPRLTRTGVKANSGDDAAGYNPVIIGDGAAPVRQGLESERNPLEYINNVAFREIAEAISRQSIAAVPAEDGTIALSIAHTDPESEFAKSVLIVAHGPAWVVESLRSYRRDGGLAREIVYDYKAQTDGTWVPVRGRDRIWGARQVNATPYLDWSFDASVAVYNDPSFDQGVFDVKLKPDAAVSDTRYHVTYRVGSEGAIAADLARYAADAREKAKSEAPFRPTEELQPTSMSRWRRGILLLNVLLLGAGACLLAVRQIRHRSQ